MAWHAPPARAVSAVGEISFVVFIIVIILLVIDVVVVVGGGLGGVGVEHALLVQRPRNVHAPVVLVVHSLVNGELPEVLQEELRLPCLRA